MVSRRATECRRAARSSDDLSRGTTRSTRLPYSAQSDRRPNTNEVSPPRRRDEMPPPMAVRLVADPRPSTDGSAVRTSSSERLRRKPTRSVQSFDAAEATRPTADVDVLRSAYSTRLDFVANSLPLLLGSRVVSVLDSGAEGPGGFKSQSRRCRVTVLGKLFTPIVLCSPSSKTGSSPFKGCGGNCWLGGK